MFLLFGVSAESKKETNSLRTLRLCGDYTLSKFYLTLNMEVIMKTFNKWSCCLAVVFVLSILFLIANPVSAAKASETKSETDATGSVAGISSGGQGSVEQNLIDPPVIESHPGPGCYRKRHKKHGVITYKYKYFEHTHPDSSEWTLVGPNCEPYGK